MIASSKEAVNRQKSGWRRIWMLVVAAGILFLAFYRLTDYPLTWFDEGSHLHVSKALVKYGVYADYSSEGFRYYGPTNGLGPTVLLPIAGVFRLLGIGLLQARLVMVVYLLVGLFLFYRLTVSLEGDGWHALAFLLLFASRGVSILEYGRQVLGEVPALVFLLGGLLVWWQAWEKPSWGKLALAGMLLGLSVVTKSQVLLFLGPALVLAWLANLVYYRLLPQRVFLLPGLVTAGLFAAWQAFLLFGLDPQASIGNLSLLRETSGSAAFVFSAELIRRSLSELISVLGYFGLLGVGLLYGATLILPRRIEAQKWSILWMMAALNLLWYVLASISWVRYAFIGLALACIFTARFLYDLTRELKPRLREFWQAVREKRPVPGTVAAQGALALAVAGVVLGSLALNVRDVLAPGENTPMLMAAYLNQHVPLDAVIETYEPEMGFLTDHRYHYPPHSYLNKTIQFTWLGGSLPGEGYDFIQKEKPEYVLVGKFAAWVQFYSIPEIESRYDRLITIGPYQLYRLRGVSSNFTP
ncbi:4-amino-4-deoxy-L-arabinose transferase [Anaerolinea thermolimosa]|uniref:4-amino-4-deoxy-L-arabinose transferase n=1 Tax=Anaerolinea thermolimosa TaxID=229919 RepID=A0A7U9PTC1_9CHLR|nr:glycosyltransferase family 39 protein [Anaerolinea thermolimosa]GAP08612.1 4-amino-4-deoxy-L-arabinose transferase [Anaerolinea thermolimosa]